MSEIAKLRKRLSNVNKNVTEYRMTVVEAKELIKEIDELLKSKEKPQQEAIIEPTTIIRIMDGGSF